jgi:hypothetical protein
MTNHPRPPRAKIAKRSKSPQRKDSASRRSSSKTAKGSRKKRKRDNIGSERDRYGGVTV